MSSPTVTGLLCWGQAGKYTAWDDRQVIAALAGFNTGIAKAARLTAGGGLTIIIDPGWLALAPCGDGTLAVLTSMVTMQVAAAPGGASARTDELRATIPDPDSGMFNLAVMPAGQTTSGILLGTITVPANATLVSQMTLTPAAANYTGGGGGPQGPPGPTGPMGPAGTTGATGPPGTTGPAGPAGPTGATGSTGAQGATGPPGSQGPQGIQGPVGPTGATGAQGPQGPAGTSGLALGPWQTLTNPGSPAGLASDSRFRYRLVGAMNAVQVDFSAHWTAAGNIWTLPAMSSDCWVSQPGGQPRIYTAQGNAASPGSAATPLNRFTFAASGVSSYNGAVGTGVATLNAIIPID